MTDPNFPEENIFGKQRGRYDEAMAHRAVRTQFQEILDLLSADDDRLQKLCAAYDERAQRVGSRRRLNLI